VDKNITTGLFIVSFSYYHTGSFCISVPNAFAACSAFFMPVMTTVPRTGLYYLKAGVREYWVIDPEQKKVQVHIYENDHYISTMYEDNASIPVTVLSGFTITLDDLWTKI